MKEILEIVFRSFWTFAGTLVLLCFLYALTALVVMMVHRMIRHLNIRRRGWPPPHCDADGDATGILKAESSPGEEAGSSKHFSA